MMHKVWSSIEEVPYCFSRSYIKLQGHTAKKIDGYDPNWAGLSRNSPMAMKLHRAWSSIEEVPYCFSRSYVKLQGHTAWKSLIFTQIGRFRTVTFGDGYVIAQSLK